MEIKMNTLITDLTYDEYDALPGIRSSNLMKMRKSMRYYKWATEQEDRRETPALKFGKLFHEAMERPSKFFETYVVQPRFDKRTKGGKQGHEDFLKSLGPTQLSIEADDMHILTGMLNAASAHPFVKNLLKEGQRESVLFTVDPETGEPIKCKYDFLTKDGEGVDFKTTIDAEPLAFTREIFRDERMYHLQGAHYTHCGKVAKVVDPNVFIVVAFEKSPPWEISVNILDHVTLTEGEKWRRHLMQQYSKAKKTNMWPGYTPKARVVIPLPWVEQPPSEHEDMGV